MNNDLILGFLMLGFTTLGIIYLEIISRKIDKINNKLSLLLGTRDKKE